MEKIHEIITKLTQLKIDGKDLRIIKNMYWEQTVAMPVDGEISSFKKNKVWCQTSMCVFSLYSEIIMRNLEVYFKRREQGEYFEIN